MKVALIQMDSRDDKAANIERALALTAQALAQKAIFVLLPEYFYFRGSLAGHPDLQKIVEPVRGPTALRFAALARQHRAHILLGSIYEKSQDPTRAYDTAVLLGPRGLVETAYRKQHLFHLRQGDREIREERIFKPGRQVSVTSVGPWTLGIAICFDVRFPDIFERSYGRGANVFAIPSSFSYTTGRAHWEVLLRARAVETLSYVLAPNQVGRDSQGALCWGHSMVVDPWGRVVAEGSGDREEIIFASIDLARINKVRARFPMYKKNP